MEKRVALEKLFAGNKRGIGCFARYCQRIALVYLKSKVAAGNHYIKEVTENLDDLAWDCIAGLFERNSQGRFVELEVYFRRENLTELSEAQVQVKTRRLVFSKVNDGLFRVFGNYDSSLSKIIRNIKNACRELDILIERIDTRNTIIFETECSQYKVEMSPEFLEINLSPRITTSMNMIEVIKQVQEVIRDQHFYVKQVPLVNVARVIRRSYVYNNEEVRTHRESRQPIFLNGELQQLLDEAISSYKQTFRSTYVDTGKVEKKLFECYLKAVRRILCHHYIQETQTGDSYFHHLKEVMPQLEKEEYRTNHRQYVEYMVKKVRGELIRKAKKVV